MNWFLLGSVFSASLIGSLHCIGMCGAFVAVYSGTGRSAPRGEIAWAHALYHVSRGLLYVSLGALSGGLGSVLDQAFAKSGLLHTAAALGSALAIGLGLSVFFPSLRFGNPLQRVTRPALVRLGRRPRTIQAGLLGFMTPLLPCGWLYAFVAVAGGTGSAFTGALTMLVFWLGNVPALLGFAALFGRLSERVRRRVPALTGVALICVGLLGIAHRAGLGSSLYDAPSGGNHPCH